MQYRVGVKNSSVDIPAADEQEAGVGYGQIALGDLRQCILFECQQIVRCNPFFVLTSRLCDYGTST